MGCNARKRRRTAPRITLDDSRLERLPAQLQYLQPYLASLGLRAALVVAGAGIATRGAAAHCRADLPRHRARCSTSPPTVPRATRSRWLFIRSSSIVMTLFSGLGVMSAMTA